MRQSFLLMSLIIAVAAATLFGCGGNQDPTTTPPSNSPSTNARSNTQVGTPRPTKQHEGPRERPALRQAKARTSRGIEPPKILTGYDCSGFAPLESFSPVKNGWRVGNPHKETIVCAGGAGYRRPRATGEFVILRTGLDNAKEVFDVVRVQGSGPVNITKAPMGGEVMTSAQRHGEIQFTSKNGVTGTLHLSDDTVTLNR